MAQGLEVLQAALAGKRVRYRVDDEEWRGWFSPDGVGYLSLWMFSPLLDASGRAAHITWDIEEPTLTFSEAVAAMDAGQTVERMLDPDRHYRKRMAMEDGWYEGGRYCQEHEGWEFNDNVIGGGFDYEAIHATDWRIVTDGPQKSTPDARPTALEVAIEVLRDIYGRAPERTAARRLETRWPQAFRPEEDNT